MTRTAITGNARVIKDRRREHRIDMADVTILGRRNVAGSLECIRVSYEPAYMTAFTATGETCMYRRQE